MQANDLAPPEKEMATASPQAPAPERRLVSKLRPFALRTYLPSPSKYALGIGRAIMLRPAIFEIWYRARALRFTVFGKGIRSLDAPDDVPKGFFGRVESYNRSQIWEFYRERTEKLIQILRTLDSVPKDARILVIGPRNEAELLLFALYGYKLKNITSVDLFSYSPLIRLADMHDLPFEEDSFDIVYSAWTLMYSYNIEKACGEIVRVAKPGGVVAAGFSHTLNISPVVGSPLRGGLEELKEHFHANIAMVHFQEVAPYNDDTSRVSLIFKVKKEGAETRRDVSP